MVMDEGESEEEVEYEVSKQAVMQCLPSSCGHPPIACMHAPTWPLPCGCLRAHLFPYPMHMGACPRPPPQQQGEEEEEEEEEDE